MSLMLRLRKWFGGRGGGVVRRPRRRRLERVLREEKATLRRWSQRASEDRSGL